MNEKIYRVLVVALLGVIAVIGAAGLLPKSSEVTEYCRAQLDELLSITALHRLQLADLTSSYSSAAYELAENINQQSFFAAEFAFKVGAILAEQENQSARTWAICEFPEPTPSPTEASN